MGRLGYRMGGTVCTGDVIPSAGDAMMLVPGCMSCDILAGKLTTPGGVIYENEYWHVDSVVSPVCWLGFLIIKLKRHCEHLGALDYHRRRSG